MKRVLLTFLSITAIGFFQFAQSGLKKPAGNNNSPKINVHRPHQSANYNWDAANSAWLLVDSSEYEYNVQGQEVSSTSSLNGTHTFRTFSTYDYLYRLILEVREVYDPVNSAWKPSFKHQIDYNGQGDVALEEASIYTSGNWQIFAGTKSFYQYNTANQVTEKIELAYIDNTIGYRENLKISDFIYDNNSNVLEQVLHSWNGTQFVVYEKQVRTFNSDNSVDLEFTYDWNTTNSTWDQNFRYTYSYGMNGSSLCLGEHYALNTYQTAFRRIINFDSFENLTLDAVEPWDGVNSVWLTGQGQETTNTYTYDQNDYMTQKINRIMDFSDTLDYTRKDYFDFETFDSHLGLEPNPQEAVSMYPNPMKSECTIDLSHLDEKVNVVKLFSAAGSEVLSVPVSENQKTVLKNEHLQSGAYFVVIETDTRKIQSRIIVE